MGGARVPNKQILFSFLSCFLSKMVSMETSVCVNRKHKDCNSVPIIRCAFCNDGVCDFFMAENQVYRDNKRCELVDDHCQTDGCVGKTKEMFEGYGTCVCSCQRGLYGRKCEYEGEERIEYPTGVQDVFPSSVHHCDKSPGFLLIQSGGGKRFTYVIGDASGGFTIFLSDPDDTNPEDPLATCEVHSLDIKVCRYFKSGMSEIFVYQIDLPLQYIPHKAATLTVGYKTTMFLRIYDQIFTEKQKLLWEPWNTSHSIHVEYPSVFDQVPIIELTNCGKTYDTRTRYRLKDSFQLISDTHFINSEYNLYHNSGLQNELKYTWKSYQIGRQFKGAHRQRETYYQLGRLTWNVPMHSWKPGFYIVRLIAQMIEVNTENYNQCYLEVVLLPLKAVLIGGQARSVKVEDPLILDATGSTDPNAPPGDVHLELTITCNWTQEAVCRPYVTTTDRYKPHVIAPNVLHPGQVYKFTLQVKHQYYTVSAEFAEQLVTVIDTEKEDNKPNTTQQASLEIECIYNCEVKINPQDITYLRVKGSWKKLRNLEFEWFTVNGEEKSVKDMRADTPSHILLILGGKLTEDKAYSFKVTRDNQFAVFSFKTSTSTNTTCLADPTSGVKGVTSFNITCHTEHADSNVQFTYEFYDKHENDGLDLSGRMLARQRTGGMASVLLTRGKVEILTFDEIGMATVTKLDVTVLENNMTAEDVEKMVTDTATLSGLEDVSIALRRASVVSEVLKPEMNREDIFELLLAFISGIRLDTFVEVKLCISTLYNILFIISRRENFTLSLVGALHGSSVLRTIGETLTRTMPLDSQCTFQTMYRMFRLLLDCIYLLLEIKNKEMQTEPYDYANPGVYSQVKGISRNVMDCLSNMASILLRRHLPSQPHQQIDSSLGNVFMWVKVHYATAMNNFTLHHNLKDKFPIIIPRQLATFLEDMDSYLGLQYTSFEQNPLSLKQVNTDCFDVFVCYKSDSGRCEYPRRLKSPIVLEFNITDITSQVEFVSGAVSQPDTSLPPEQLDLDVPVYRLDVVPRASVQIEFELDPDIKELRVLVEKRFRPGYELVMAKGLIISANNSVYHVVYEVNDEPEFYYMAVLPAPSAPKNTVVKYKYKASSKVCYSWHGQWDTESCQVKEDSNKDHLVCECTHLSLFSALVEATPTSLDTVEDFPILFSRFSSLQNQLTLFIALLLCFLLLVLVAAWVDRHNRVKRFAVVLKDNYPGDRYGYLICVSTGARIGAGTDAPIGIRMYGSANDSRPHILASDQHDVMEGLGEDWFVLYTPEPLGDIDFVRIWHDNSGHNPNWFCDSVLIYDLTRMNCYFFLVNEWVTLSYKRIPQVFVFPTSLEDLTAGPRVFLDNLKSGFVLSHLWMSTIVRHPRDPVTRVDRLAIILCFILVAMATGLGLIVLTDECIEIDDPSYSVTKREFIISLFSLATGTASVCFLMEMFRKTYKIIFFRNHKERINGEVKSGREFVTYEMISHESVDPDIKYLHYGSRQSYQKKKSSFWNRVNLRLTTAPLIPVQLQKDKPNVFINWVWFTITWYISLVGIYSKGSPIETQFFMVAFYIISDFTLLFPGLSEGNSFN